MLSLRRILLILAALLILGGGTFVACIAEDAASPDSLRFTLVETAGPREIYAGLSGPCSVESIAIENTSATPVHLISMWVVEGESSGGRARINFAIAPEPAREALGTSASSGDIVIPPRRTIYATSGIPLTGIESGTSSVGEDTDLRMNFLWQPRLRHLAGRVFEWIYARSPRSVQPHIPSLPASMDHASIEFAIQDVAIR